MPGTIMTAAARRDARVAAINRALAHHRSRGYIRSVAWEAGRLHWVVTLSEGDQRALKSLPEAEVFCAALASAAQAISRSPVHTPERVRATPWRTGTLFRLAAGGEATDIDSAEQPDFARWAASLEAAYHRLWDAWYNHIATLEVDGDENFNLISYADTEMMDTAASDIAALLGQEKVRAASPEPDPRCTASSWQSSTHRPYGPHGYNRCTEDAGGHVVHVDGFGNRFHYNPDAQGGQGDPRVKVLGRD